MIRRLIPLVALILSSSAMAQVGIGTKKAASSAQLDVVALKKGVLLPRVELKASTAFDPIEGERIESLLVYHTGNTELVAGFYYWKSNAWTPLLSGDTYIDRKNYSFTIAGNPTKNGEESLVVTDNQNHSIYLAVAEIANNTTFVTNLVDNQEFITKLGDNVEFINHITNNNEFIENIINKLKGTYGNVNYNSTTNTFVYYDENGNEHEIDWSRLNTTNVSFTLVNDRLVVTDSEGNAVSVAVEEIANNTTFVTNLVDNQEFITKLGDNIDFINHITNNNEFIENIINELKKTYGNVSFDVANNSFYYYDEHGDRQDIDWESLNTVNVSFKLIGDELVITDSDNNTVKLAVTEIANNKTFVENIANNNDFITKLGDNIDFINHITNNNEFIENIINELKKTYGNVSFDVANNSFYYYDEHGDRQDIDWEALNTVNVSFKLIGDELVITDSDNNTVKLAVTEIANNKTFVENIANNNDFITKLGDNIDFINHITNNNEFIENIINELKKTYGNVSFDVANNSFYYYDEHGDRQDIDWEALNTVNVSFKLIGDELVITDSDNNTVKLAVTEIANNKTFVENIANNNDFITKLGDNIDFINHITNNNEFIENIINKLTKKYGNVNYDPVNNTFFYYDENDDKQDIDWSALNTVNVSFTLENDHLIVTDSNNQSVSLAVEEIANNKTFVENIANNNDFITKLGDNIDFINHITNNNEFIENIINKLTKKYGNVNYDPVNNTFFYYDENDDKQDIDWSALNTVNVSFTLENDHLIVTDSNNQSVSLAVEEIAKNSTFVTNLVDNQEFITKLGDNIDFINQITNNNEFIENIINKLTKKYGNVNYDPVNNTFFYYDENDDKQDIDWSALNTVNVSFTLENDHLIVTDSNNQSVSLAVEEIAKNSTFVTNLVDNQEFITKLGDNIDFINQITNNNEFIDNIINKLTKKYGNVNYDPVNNTFFYYDENDDKQDIDWSALNTVNVSFTLENDHLIVTDSNNQSVSLAVEEIAKNSTFVTNLVDNQEFITKLGDSIDFINQITNNNEFIDNIINKLTKKYGNVNYDPVNNTFFYYDENDDKQDIDWSALNTVNVSFTLENDHLIVTDSNNQSVSLAVEEIAKNSTFVTNLVDNQEFITKLGDSIDFINQITNNNEFIDNIINKLTKKYGNVNYDPVNNTFFYYDENDDKQDIDWSALNTVNVSFTLENDHLIVTDSNNQSVSLAVEEIAKNSTFVTNLVDNQEFITKLGDSIDFINQITNNNEFIDNIINKLTKKYGNVNYDPVNNTFFYYDENDDKQDIDWSALNTVNVSFTLENDHLIVTDSNNQSVSLAVEEIAKNSTFVTNLVDNQEFITKLGDSIDFINQITNNNEFIDNIINKLTKKYGNVNYDPVNNTFFYYDENDDKQDIDWTALNTVNDSFKLIGDELVITDSDNNTVTLAVEEIAKNSTFVTNLVDNQEFITKLGDSSDFQTIIKNNSVEAVLNLTDETINTNGVKAGFTFNNGKNPSSIQFSETLTAMEKGVDSTGKIEYYFIDETTERDDVIMTITQDVITDFEKIINDSTVNNLLKQFISTATGDVSVIRDTAGDIIIKTATNEFNLTNEIQAKETNTTLTSSGAGVYVYKNEETIKTNGVGITINVVADVQNNFQEIIDNTSVKNILNTLISDRLDASVTYENDKLYVNYKDGRKEEIVVKDLIQSSGENLSTDGVIGVTVNGVVGIEAEKAVIKPFKLILNEESVTTNHIKNGTLLLEDFAKGTANTVLATDQIGTPYWMDTNDITTAVNVGNGLTMVANQIQLGGILTQPTAITVSDTNHLALKNVNRGTSTIGDRLVVMDAEGVLKQVNAAMPRYFYMPAATIPSHNDLTGLALTGTIEVNLYEIYKNQYGFTNTATQVRSNPSSTLPVYTANELDYFVTYYDNTVFTNVTLSSSGVLRYQVRSNSEITASTYMNIVFKVKE